MVDKARQYKPSTVRRLDTLSGNKCAAPDCTRNLIARDHETIISKICHIEAANKNGPRYNPTMSDDDRRHFTNLILLCDECHTMIDNKENEKKYPKELLFEWKEKHESKLKFTILSKNPLLINQAINGIASLNFEEDLKKYSSDLKAFAIDQKINYNGLKRNKTLIQEYAKFYPKINSLYSALEKEGSFKKEKLLRNIQLLYVRTKGSYVNGAADELNEIFKNADNIFEEIEDELLKSVDASQSVGEDISFAIPIVMVDAFIRCKILENPLSS